MADYGSMERAYEKSGIIDGYRDSLSKGREKLISKSLLNALLDEHMAVRQLIQLLGLPEKGLSRGGLVVAHRKADRELEARELFLREG